ncbi:hypothetical protein Q7O_001740 [Pectobacterium carotovorum subsp. carotovorum PCCS1]|nr:hypothetical protein [Pectobacterium carotovorum subsp. carotovorum PCCS1]
MPACGKFTYWKQAWQSWLIACRYFKRTLSLPALQPYGNYSRIWKIASFKSSRCRKTRLPHKPCKPFVTSLSGSSLNRTLPARARQPPTALPALQRQCPRTCHFRSASWVWNCVRDNVWFRWHLPAESCHPHKSSLCRSAKPWASGDWMPLRVIPQFSAALDRRAVWRSPDGENHETPDDDPYRCCGDHPSTPHDGTAAHHYGVSYRTDSGRTAPRRAPGPGLGPERRRMAALPRTHGGTTRHIFTQPRPTISIGHRGTQ